MLRKTYVKSDDGGTYLVDTIEYAGGLWLCPDGSKRHCKECTSQRE